MMGADLSIHSASVTSDSHDKPDSAFPESIDFCHFARTQFVPCHLIIEAVEFLFSLR
jgi:hypothetical protein